MLLRANLTENWVKHLSEVVQSYNHTPIKKLGWLAPENINSVYDSFIVTNAQKKNNILVYKEPSLQEQLQNESNLKLEDIKEGDYVYLSSNEKLFDKSYDVKVRILCYKISIFSSKSTIKVCFVI
jgi:hypothetical protein